MSHGPEFRGHFPKPNAFALTPEQHERINLGLRERAWPPSESDPTTVRIAIISNLVGTNIDDLQGMIARAVARGNRFFTIDLRSCPYVDLRGHRGLGAIVRFVTEHGGGVRIANANSVLRARFAEKGLTNHVRLIDEPEEVTP